ncbi:MAG TPA: hypothetical protein VGR53_02095, partial [Nitrososphaerales archaeon]|nr:hypothetical protein [Nitrososphaerales archaeon]
IPLIHSSRRKEWIGSILVGVGLTWTYLLFSTNVIASTWDTQSLLFYTPPGWMLAYGLGILIYTGRFTGKVWRFLRWLVPPMLVVGGFGLPLSFPSFVQEYEFFYPLVTLGFAAVVANPPNFLRYGAVIGEGSYAMYATHSLFLLVFGTVGVPLVIIVSFGIEFALRPREISRRLNLPSSGRISLKWSMLSPNK